MRHRRANNKPGDNRIAAGAGHRPVSGRPGRGQRYRAARTI